MSKRIKTPQWYDDNLKEFMDTIVIPLWDTRAIWEPNVDRKDSDQISKIVSDFVRSNPKANKGGFNEIFDWNNPILLELMMVQEKKENAETRFCVSFETTGELAALHLIPWVLKGKPVFRFEEESAGIVMESDNLDPQDMDLSKLPTNTFVLEFIENQQEYQYLIIARLDEVDNSNYLLMMPIDTIGPHVPSKQFIKHLSLAIESEDSNNLYSEETDPDTFLDELMPSTAYIMNKCDDENDYSGINEEHARRIMNLIAYIAYANNDIKCTHDPTEPLKTKKKINPKKDSTSVCKHFEVGAIITEGLRRFEQRYGRYSSNNSDEKRHIRPHLRRAHWHRYRTGPKTDWEYSLRWIPPTFINPDNDDPATTPMSIFDI